MWGMFSGKGPRDSRILRVCLGPVRVRCNQGAVKNQAELGQQVELAAGTTEPGSIREVSQWTRAPDQRATIWQKVTTKEGKGRTIPELQPSVTSPAGQRRGDYAELVSKL